MKNPIIETQLVRYFRKFDKTMVMDLQTRKLNLIAYLAQIHDENFIERIEKFISRKQESKDFDFEPLTVN